MPLGRNFDYDTAARTLGLDTDWYEDDAQMRDDIAARWGQANPQQRQSFARDMVKNRPKKERPVAGEFMGNDHGYQFARDAFNASQMGSVNQANHLQGMINKTTDAITDENERRVAISREMRRMAHEQELERMRQETERMKVNALIQRLQQQSGSGPRMSGEGFAIY